MNHVNGLGVAALVVVFISLAILIDALRSHRAQRQA